MSVGRGTQETTPQRASHDLPFANSSSSSTRCSPILDKKGDSAPGEGPSPTYAKPKESTALADKHSASPGVTDANTQLPFSRARCIALVATVTGASFLNTLSIQATIIILPAIGDDLDIADSRLQWIVSAYALTFGCFLLLWGRIADIYGKRLIFIWGTVWVAAVTLANPFVKNEVAFNLFRGLQGLGAAANVPTAIGILGTTFPPSKAKNYAFSTYAAGAPLGSIFGNLIGGFIASYAHWKWVFITMGLFSAFIAAVACFVIPSPKANLHAHGAHAKTLVDWIGGFLITAGLICLMFALTQGNVVGWKTPWISCLIVASLILIAVFVLWQRHLENAGKCPLMKVSIFRSSRFSGAMVIMALFFGSFNNFLVYATYFFQEYQGYDEIQTTLRFLPTGVMGIITAIIVAKILHKVPTFLLLLFGNFSVSLANLLFAAPIPPKTSYFAYGLPAMVFSVFGADTTWPSLTLFTSTALPHEDQALGGALINAVGQFGRAIALAVATAIQIAVMASERGVDVENSGRMEEWEEASLKGLRAANWFGFGLGLCSMAVVIVFFRGAGVVGKVGPALERETSGGEGVMNGEDIKLGRV